MPEQCLLFGCEVEINKEKTRQWYRQAAEWGCGCGDCVNFLALARQQKLPEKILHTLSDLGIPPEKATYVCLLAKEQGECFYQFSYRIAGRIHREPETSAPGDARCCHETYPYGAADFPEPHFDLEFYANLPRVAENPAR